MKANVRLVKQLKKGNHGSLSLVRERTGRLLIAKEIDLPEDENSCNEAKAMSILSHPFILRMESSEVIASESQFGQRSQLLLLEYCDRGDLGDFIRKLQPDTRSRKSLSGSSSSSGIPSPYLSVKFITDAFVQVLLALYHLHYPDPASGRPALIHRDIKAANVFITRDQTFRLGDFGLCRPVTGSDQDAWYQKSLSSAVGTPQSMSPEICEGKKCMFQNDFFSLPLLSPTCSRRSTIGCVGSGCAPL